VPCANCIREQHDVDERDYGARPAAWAVKDATPLQGKLEPQKEKKGAELESNMVGF
jgi:hypothetical protein